MRAWGASGCLSEVIASGANRKECLNEAMWIDWNPLKGDPPGFRVAHRLSRAYAPRMSDRHLDLPHLDYASLNTEEFREALRALAASYPERVAERRASSASRGKGGSGALGTRARKKAFFSVDRGQLLDSPLGRG
ncbi:MAG: hypothetical protein H6Q00_1428 [Holophagaceae bacterium]|nr:hypothetical protein [Holophagaceae bacterium]